MTQHHHRPRDRAGNARRHWDDVFKTQPSEAQSWFQREPTLSLRMMESAGLTPATCVIDVGCGDSRLIDRLVQHGLTCLTALDVSPVAIARLRARLGAAASTVTWIEADVTDPSWQAAPVDIWHDRAVFHFLTQPVERQGYLARVRALVKPGGHAIIATFALNGPSQCSGLPVVRYSSELLAAEFGDRFEVVERTSEHHLTGANVPQSYQWTRFRYLGP